MKWETLFGVEEIVSEQGQGICLSGSCRRAGKEGRLLKAIQKVVMEDTIPVLGILWADRS